jgi:hypothetical protein
MTAEPSSAGKRRYVTYMGDDRTIGGRQTKTLALKDAFTAPLAPGERVEMLPGKYWLPGKPDADLYFHPRPIEIKGAHGQPDRPIVISGSGEQTQLCGSNAAVPLYPKLPELNQPTFFKLIDCSWIEIESFKVDSCWPTFVFIANCHHITVRNIRAEDGLYLVFARGERTSNILIEECDWQQDPSGTIWPTLLWDDVHGDETIKDGGKYAYLNGGLFGSDGIKGSVIVRNNRVCDAYNVVRMVGVSGNDQLNANVWIQGNRFERIRDNISEPEKGATNWWVDHNQIIDCHAWFTYDGVDGGWHYVFANTGWFTSRPGQEHDENRGGRILKFQNQGPFNRADRPIHVFHNSWYLRQLVTKDGYTEGLRHLNNALQFCKTADHPSGACTERDRLVDAKFLGAAGDGAWPASVIFDGDVTNIGFGTRLLEAAQELRGISNPQFHFQAPLNGDFIPVPMVASARPVVLKAGTDWPGSIDWTSDGDGQLAGAVQPAPGGWRMLDGPAFIEYQPNQQSPGWITRLHETATSVVISVSRPLRSWQGSVTLVAKVPDDVRPAIAVAAGYTVTIGLDPAWRSTHGLAEVMLSTALFDLFGQPVSSWAVPRHGLKVSFPAALA